MNESIRPLLRLSRDILVRLQKTDVRTAMRHQHPGLESIREAIDQRNPRHNPHHSELRVQ